MAEESSLLLRIKGDSSGAKQATAETRAAIAALRQHAGNEFNQIQTAAQSAFSNIGNSINLFATRNLPLVGGAFAQISDHLRGFSTETGKGAAEIAKFEKTLAGLSATTGKSTGELTKFLTTFLALPNATDRGIAGYIAFGSKFDELNPKLEQAAGEMVAAASATEGLGASLASVAGPIGIAVIAAAALAASAALVTKEFIDLTVSTAEWEGKLFDLSQQVGISTETLSALEVLAKTTGGSIEGITASLGIFQKKLEEAQDPESKSAALLKSLGIETNNTEEAFRQAITALAGMEEGYHQTATALELFGRGGKSVLAIIKETNGDLDTAIAKFREMGLVVSEEDAKAADAFNDQLAVIQFQLRATTALLVRDAIPQILSVLKQVSQILKENRDAVEAVGSAINIFVKGNIGILVGTLKTLELVLQGVRDSWLAMKAALAGAVTGRIDIIMNIFQSLKQEQQTLSALGAADAGQGLQGESIFGGLQGGFSEPQQRIGGGRTGRRAAVEKLSAGQKLLNSLIDEYNHLQEKEQNLTKFEIIQKELLKKQYAGISDELEQQIKDYATWITIDEQKAEQQKKNIEANKEYLRVINQIREGINRDAAERVDIENRVAEAVQQQREALAELEGFEKTHLQTVEEYIADAVKQAEAVGGVTEKMKEYFALLIKIAAKEDEIEANRKRFQGVEGGAEGISSTFQGDAFSELAKVLNENLTGNKLTAAVAGLQTLETAFQGVAEAVGQAIEAFVLYGNSGTSIRKFVAEILAAVARMAAVQAVWELAQGFAMLALNFFIPNPKYAQAAAAHFTAAAIYGSIAAVAAVAGRGVAGNSFNQPAGGSSGGRGSSSPPQALQTIETGRNQRQPIIIVIRPDGTKFAEAVTAHVQSDFGDGGRLRELILTDGR